MEEHDDIEIKDLVDWFFDHYEDPAESQYYEDGYIWTVPARDAYEELEDRFGHSAPDALIRLAVERIERDGLEWVCKADLADPQT